VYVCALEHVN